jgi:hypothetical protein
MVAAVVTGGFVRFSFTETSVFQMTMAGPDFSVAGGFVWIDTSWPGFVCQDCQPGTSMVPAASVSVRSLPGIIRFSGPAVVLTDPGLVTGTFELTGVLCKSWVDTTVQPCPGWVPVTGHGSVAWNVIEYRWPDNQRVFSVTDATYTFAIPEPSTCLLISPALALIAALVVRRRRA